MLQVFNVWSGETIAEFFNSSECWDWIMEREDAEDWDVREENINAHD